MASSPTKEKAASRSKAKAKEKTPGLPQDLQPYAPGGGLHPSFFSFQEETGESRRLSLAHEDFKEVCMRDLFDTIIQQDRLDGGVSLLLRCPGFIARPNLGPENIIADVYITPCTFNAAHQKMSESVAILIQGFCQEFALPHLHSFTKSCNIEAHALSITLHSSPYLPLAAIDGTHICCSAQPYVAPSSSTSKSKRVTSKAAKPSGAENDMKVGVSTPQAATQSQVHQRHNADRFAPDEVAKAILDATSGKSSTLEATALSPHPIISIGANTDAVLDRFGLSDQIIPRLRELVTSMRSSCWEATLRNTPWNLNYEQATNLQRALHADLGVDMPLLAKTSFSIWKAILKFLLTLLLALATFVFYYLFWF
ncbi:hypothetical protein JVU11DRAFT_9841 [Chiua virens]|nr:hypothetical protein JVU11DRAFT_9841 [Chiua virens]